MALDISFWAALAAGFLSFLSPCVLPLVPPYLCFITGASLRDLGDGSGAMTRRALAASLFFVLGFSAVFVAMGASASYIGQLLRQHMELLSQAAGIFIILMGLHFLGVFRFAILNREVRYHQEAKPAGLLGAFLVGIAFGFGWTPCIGPILGTILAISASTESVGQGALLLAAYSAGLGVPFLLAALGTNAFLAFFRRFRSQMANVERAMGILLILTGLMFLTGTIRDLAYWIQEMFPALTRLG